MSTYENSFSDHKMVKLIMSLHLNVKNDLVEKESEGFRALNFSKADYASINERIREKDWVEIQSMCSFEEFPVLITYVIL